MNTADSTAARSWLETSDAVLRGLNHEFSNRLSLARLAPQLEAMLRTGEHGLSKLMDDTAGSEDLLQLLRLYRLMVFGVTDPAEPVMVADVVGDAINLFKHHTSFRDLEVVVSVDTSAPPVLMNPQSLTQSLLLLLGAAARQLEHGSGDDNTITLEFDHTADAVRITARVRPAGDESPVVEAPELAGLRYLVRDAEGAVELTRCGATLSVGTLLRLRALEKLG